MASDKPFGCGCRRPTLAEIQTPAIYSVRRIAERSGMSQAQVLALASARNVRLHRAGGTTFIRRADIHRHMPEIHRAASRIKDPARMADKWLQ